MAAKKIALLEPTPMPRACTMLMLESADRVIALKEAEHRPLLAARFPGWEQRVEYWHVHDLDQATPADTLRQIEAHVEVLINELTEAAGAQSA